MAQTEIRVGGFGGQGVILSGIIIGRAAAIHGGLHATLMQSFGPEARGSSSSAELIVSDRPIWYPYVRELDILIVLSQDAYARFGPKLKPDGLLVTEADMVRLEPKPKTPRYFSVAATRLAEGLGRRMVLNVVTVGFFGAVSRLVPSEALERAVAESVPPGTEELNLKAFRAGFAAGLDALNPEPRSALLPPGPSTTAAEDSATD